MSQISDYFLITYLCSILLIAAIIDIRIQKIPNLLTYPAAVLAVIYHCVTNGISGFLFSLGGLATGLGLLFIPYLLGGMGAGDAKLMGVVGGTIGAKGVFFAFLSSAIVGGIYALILVLIYRQQFRGFFKNLFTSLANFILMRKYISDPVQDDQNRPRLCYGLAVALGTNIYIILKMTKSSYFIL